MSNDNVERRVQALEKSSSETSVHLLEAAFSIYKQQKMNALLAKGLLQAKEDTNSVLEVIANMPGIVGTEAGAEIKRIFNRNISFMDQIAGALNTVNARLEQAADASGRISCCLN